MQAHRAIIDGIVLTAFSNLAEIETEWRQLENSGVAMAFQHFEWSKAWLEQMAPMIGAEPLILCGRYDNGNLAFILPFQRRIVARVRILEWLGQQNGNACGGLFETAFCLEAGQDWFNRNFPALLHKLGPLDAVNLRNMPSVLMGKPNPVAALRGSPAANASFILKLQPHFNTVLEKKRSSRSISKMRRRDERLEESGLLVFDVLTGASADAALAEGMHHKNLQLKKIGVSKVFSDADIRFYQQILRADPGTLQVFRLQLDGKCLVTMLGARADGCFWLLISALSPDIDLQFSPGDYLLRRTIAHACERGLTIYDFSLGEQTYKQLWADERIEYFNKIEALNIRGMIFAVPCRNLEAIKRMVKQDTHLRDFYYGVRQRLRGK